jgi:hypothetical protein
MTERNAGAAVVARSPVGEAREVHRPRRRLDPDLPVVDNIARVIGAGPTALLISTFGGGRVYIARRPRPGDAMARVIGGEAANLLSTIFGGERVWFRNDAGHLTRKRIRLMRHRGMSVARIARELRLSDRYVYKVLAELRER